MSSPPASVPPPVLAEGALSRALGEAGGVSGAFASAPCRFLVLGADAGLALRSIRSGPGVWVLVTVRASREPAHQAHLRERCRTAVQRFVLALACEGVEGAWIEDELPDAEGFRASGVDLVGQEPAGLVWCAA